MAVEDFALDLGGLQSFLTDQLDFEPILIVLGDVLEGTEALSGKAQKLCL